jgi:putative hydrolase of the HAD superfamily
VTQVTDASERSLTTLVVDYGGVLTTSLDVSFRAFTDAHDLDTAHLREVVLGPGPDGRVPIQLIETGSITLDEFEAELAARLRTRSGSTLQAQGLVRAMFAGAAPDERMIAAVRAAREVHGLRTGLLSNSWGNREQYDFPHFDALFDAVVISGEVGLRKPDPDIYRLMARELGVEPHECVFVDDIEANIRAAAEVGMCGIHHTDTDRTLVELGAVFGRNFG